MKLSGKTSVITGSASGMEPAEAELFALEGARVCVCDVQELQGGELVERISSAGGDANFRHLDVAIEEDWKALTTDIQSRRGPYRHRGPGWHAGVTTRRPRQLDGAGEDGEGYGRCDGSGARRQSVIVLMEHTDREGNPKVVDSCTLPLTGRRVVNRIITDMAVIDVAGNGKLILRELAPGTDAEQVAAVTGAPLCCPSPAR